MKPARRTAVRLARGLSAILLLAAWGCGGQEGPAGNDADDQGSGMVSTRGIDDLGTVLVDADGSTLYTNEAETGGEIRCVGACAGSWPPVLIEEGSAPSEVDGVDGAFGEVTRPDGRTQLTLDGSPLYTFAEDEAPGSAKGDGLSDEFQGTTFVWHAAQTGGRPPPEDGGDDGGYGY